MTLDESLLPLGLSVHSQNDRVGTQLCFSAEALLPLEDILETFKTSMQHFL